MGDISELRGIIVIVSFLGLLVLLMAQIPSALYTVGSERDVDVPTQWEGIDLQSFQDTWNSTSLFALSGEDFDIGGRNMHWISSYSANYLSLHHRYGFLLMGKDFGAWYNRNGVDVTIVYNPIGDEGISATELDNDFSTHGNTRFTVKYDEEARFQVSIFFAFNETDYASPSLAWASDDLNVLVGINFDNINTAFSAWDLIARLLFFQLPTISPILNAIIAIPIWVAVAYLAYVLVIKVIPLIAGG